MSWTVTTPNLGTGVEGNRRKKYLTFTGPASYVTGGESFTPALAGLEAITHFGSEVSSTGFVCAYDYTNQKVKWFVSGAQTAALQEVANAVDVSTAIVRVCVTGI